MLRRLATSATAFAWAGSLFALRQAASASLAWAPGCSARRRELATELDRLAWEASRHLRGLDLEAFQAGDSLERDLVDLLLPADPWQPGDWISSAAAAAELSVATLRYLSPGAAGRGAWRELGNKLQVYRLVRQVATKLDLPGPGEPFDLPVLVGRAYRLDDYSALWAVEGLGHDYAAHGWPRGGPAPRDLLAPRGAPELPPRSLAMLDAGVGLAVAERLLGELPPGVPAERTRETVAEVLRLCRANARAGYTGAALESLGLVTRTFHGGRVAAVDEALGRLGEEEAREYFWHGVGRALYFLPVNFLPFGDTTWRPFRMAREEAPDAVARDNAFAGLGWAFALVNMRRPELLDELLLTPHADELRRQPGFANGVASSLLMRQDTTPDSALLADFLAWRPKSAAAWRELVEEPAVHALGLWPRLRDEGRLEEIFRFQDWIGAADRRSGDRA